MRRVKNIQELLDSNGAEFYYVRNGSKFRLSKLSIKFMVLNDVLNLIEVAGLYYCDEKTHRSIPLAPAIVS